MKIIKNIMVNFKMIFTNYGFYICTAFTIILCFCAGIYRDPINNNEYSVIKSLIEFDREFMLNDNSFCSYKVAENGSGSWLSMFIPIISAFTFIPLVCDESESKFIRFSVFRSSKFNYHISKFLTACISGGLAVAFGYIIFTVSIYAVFPNINDYSKELQTILKEEISYIYPKSAGQSYIFILGIKSAEMFIYGAISSVPSIMLTCLIKNKYLVMCIPFFIKYTVTQTSTRLSSQALSNIENPNIRLLKFSAVISPDSILNVFNSPNMRLIFIYNGTLVLTAFLFYIIVCGRRFDCGE